ncbi:hypothetical protein FB562_2610 [Homoserinimonas aerilata]|uniref:Polysaccharide chain length determinant N-terminal domain-containing protein n=1 Tax=Homoserinimonas aerilata TaxID=1162970 RepID=A0A542Y1S0_9MICO|nr:hypothetical protein [Homoserinimonas aerilata]TQL42020.1 hypothetical protein FB562_2610 [Homoserinimonas aerilata]
MNFSDTLRGLLRRWYIVVPGLLAAAAIAIGAWFAIPPGYNRSATQLLLPGANSIPEGANPYLFLGGLAPAADVLVRAIGSENVVNDMAEKHPGVEIAISRDTTTAGPIILITVTADSDAAAEEVLTLLVERTATVLEDFQTSERIPADNRMSVIPHHRRREERRRAAHAHPGRGGRRPRHRRADPAAGRTRRRAEPTAAQACAAEAGGVCGCSIRTDGIRVCGI